MHDERVGGVHFVEIVDLVAVFDVDFGVFVDFGDADFVDVSKFFLESFLNFRPKQLNVVIADVEVNFIGAFLEKFPECLENFRIGFDDLIHFPKGHVFAYVVGESVFVGHFQEIEDVAV